MSDYNLGFDFDYKENLFRIVQNGMLHTSSYLLESCLILANAHTRAYAHTYLLTHFLDHVMPLTFNCSLAKEKIWK